MKSVVVFLLVASAALPLAFLARADPTADGEVLPSANDAGAAPPSGYAPDPIALVTRHQWVLDLRYRSGTLIYGGARRVELPSATPTVRMMGRFAVELYVGPQLLDRVRFDFPLLGADELAGNPRRWDSPPSFERNLSTQAAIMIPNSERATRAFLVDRATGRAWALPWPFVPLAPRADAGVRARPDARE
jgi:hypothetical protein